MYSLRWLYDSTTNTWKDFVCSFLYFVNVMTSSDEKTTRAFLQHERQRHQIYRRTKKRERAELRATVAQLDDELKALTSNKSRDLLLSWKEVALAVQESNENAQSERQALKAQVARLRKVVQAMKGWVTAAVVDTMSLDAMIPTWRNVTLLADPVSRILGKKWITERMFHHTDATGTNTSKTARHSCAILRSPFLNLDASIRIAARMSCPCRWNN
ncbi:hypothetical protein AC1031_008505 [Aphanomyces cochlioides]|nr:hypothetical protein AC1031_008505 [Aphanomyces cochlioides]